MRNWNMYCDHHANLHLLGFEPTYEELKLQKMQITELI